MHRGRTLRFLFFTFVLSANSNLYSQEYRLFKHGSYWLTKLDVKEKMKTNRILILMDTANYFPLEDKNQTLAERLVAELKEREVNASLAFWGIPVDTINTLVVRLKSLPPGRVKLTLFAKDIPVCRKYEIQLSGKVVQYKNFYEYPELSINTSKEEGGIRKSTKKLAKLLSRRLK